MDGFTVTCPYHGWSYDVRDGTCFVSPDARLPTWPVRVVGDAVCVRL
jgi:nitrite reductase/ring-hydroxylating ferredoxin subunit